MDERPAQSQDFSRERFLRLLRRWTLLVLVSGAVAGLSAYGLSKAVTPEYRATARLFLAPAASQSAALQEVLLGQSLARSYVELATADVVLSPAMTNVGLSDLNAFRGRTQVTQVRDTFVIAVSFLDPNPQRATDAANAIAASFIAATGSLQASLQGTVTLWQPAVPPTDPESPRPGLNALLGAVAGTLVALLSIAIVSYLDDRITDPDELRRRLGTAPLGEIQRTQNPDSFAGKLFVRDQPTSTQAEAFRSLRANILFADVDRPPRTILVTSAVPREGKSIVSANLALAFAQTGIRTILIDADLRRPSQHRLFGIKTSPGLTNILALDGSYPDLRSLQVAPNLAVIPSGPLPPTPGELLSSDKMSAFLKQLLQLADNCTVIIDTSPVLAVSDPLELAPKVDGCVLVIDSARTHTSKSLRAISALRGVHGRILGAVMNKVRQGEATYYYQYYGPTEPN